MFKSSFRYVVAAGLRYCNRLCRLASDMGQVEYVGESYICTHFTRPNYTENEDFYYCRKLSIKIAPRKGVKRELVSSNCFKSSGETKSRFRLSVSSE